MISINLIPAPRRVARARRRRMMAWASAGAAYGAFLVLGCAALRLAGPRAAPGLDERAAEARRGVEQAEAKARTLTTELQGAARELAAVRAVTRHADWSILLDRISRARAGEVVLETCELERIAPPPPRPAGDAAPGEPPAAPVRGYILRIAGVAREQRTILPFVLRLEELGLFERVTLVESRSRAVAGAELAAFRIECALRAGGGQ